jgi:hypothetical protein
MLQVLRRPLNEIAQEHSYDRDRALRSDRRDDMYYLPLHTPPSNGAPDRRHLHFTGKVFIDILPPLIAVVLIDLPAHVIPC